jgi:catechol 2,3-dioxygenase-like lactoylglutathione lyase family enzyme
VITSLGHIAIRISHLDAALDFYRDGLGFREAFRLDRDGEPWIVYLQVASGQFVELFPGGEPAARARNEVGYVHLCLTVDDIQATIEELSARAVAFDGEPKLGLDGNWQVWTADPDGNRIELMQIMPDSLQAQAMYERSE